MNPLAILLTLSLTVAFLSVTGCSGDSATGPNTSGQSSQADTHGGTGGHAHPTEGPHHGDLIELGNEEYHAELLHDEVTQQVTIYILNGAATDMVPIDAPEIMINLRHDGSPEQYQLTASPGDGDPEGQSSRFNSTNTELGKHLDEEGADPRLVLTINGKSYRGVIPHDHGDSAH